MRIVAVLSAALLVATQAAAQDASGGDPVLEHLQRLAERGRALKSSLGARHQYLSSAGQRLVGLGSEELQAAFRRAREARVAARGQEQVSDPLASEDFISRLAGNTQSGSSLGWCGRNAVSGFNDWGSFVATFLGMGGSASGSFSINGFAYSTNAGRNFTDGGILLSDPVPAGVAFRDLFGDPVVRCSDSDTFYYAAQAEDTPVVTTDPRFSGISVSTSTDGGVTWGGAVMASSKDAALHFLDKPWMDVKGGNIYVTYTDFEFAPNATCGTEFHTTIELVRSTDGGGTWSLPLVLDTICGNTAFLQASQVAVGNAMDVYAAWESYPMGFLPPRSIQLRRSTDAGASFAAAVQVSDVTPVGGGRLLQGGFRSFFDLQGLGVDRGGKNDGRVYVSWQDGRNLSQPDFYAEIGSYNFADVLLAKSDDGGANWSAPARVNNDFPSRPVDQYLPALAVDPRGTVGVFFYDRRRDARNFLIDAMLATSRHGHQSFKNMRLTRDSFAPIHANDLAVSDPTIMTDYDAVATDRTGAFRGFLVSWSDNSRGDANIVRARLMGGGGGNDDDDHDDDRPR
jgi:hypothetical protein